MTLVLSSGSYSTGRPARARAPLVRPALRFPSGGVAAVTGFCWTQSSNLSLFIPTRGTLAPRSLSGEAVRLYVSHTPDNRYCGLHTEPHKKAPFENERHNGVQPHPQLPFPHLKPRRLERGTVAVRLSSIPRSSQAPPDVTLQQGLHGERRLFGKSALDFHVVRGLCSRGNAEHAPCQLQDRGRGAVSCIFRDRPASRGGRDTSPSPAHSSFSLCFPA